MKTFCQKLETGEIQNVQDPMAKMCLIYQLLDCIDFLLFYLFIFGGWEGQKILFHSITSKFILVRTIQVLLSLLFIFNYFYSFSECVK